MGLGGWSPNVLHFYDPNDHILYLGSGARRSGARLGVVKEDGTETFIASEDGLTVYVFDTDTGRHLRTTNAVTGNTAYTFAYGSDGALTSITDGDGNVTAFNGGTITGPFSDVTVATVGGADLWTDIPQGVGTLSLTYSGAPASPFADPGVSAPIGAGVAQSLIDPRGKPWTYTFDGFGRLLHDVDPRGGKITLTQAPAGPTALQQLGVDPNNVAEALTTTLGTAGGKSFAHDTVTLKSGGKVRRTTTPDGTLTIEPDFSATANFGAYGSATSTYMPGQHAKVSTTLPDNLGQLETTHHVTLGDPTDPRTVTGVTDTAQFGGATTTTLLSGTTITTTTPAGRTITTTVDGQGRPTQVTTAGLPDIVVAYDQSGRVTSVTQGSLHPRATTYTYDGAFLASSIDALGRTTAFQHDGAGNVTNAAAPGNGFGFARDENGNVTGVTSPQAAGYSEPSAYDDANLPLTSTSPAGATTVAYDKDRTANGGGSPWGALTFDAKGRITGVGSVTYARDASGFVTGVSSAADGQVTVDNGAAPTSVEWDGPVHGTVGFQRNARQQVTAMTVGPVQIARTVDADGVVAGVGDLSITRTAGAFISDTTLNSASGGPITDHYDLNEFGEANAYAATVNGTPVFTATYTRDDGGRLTGKTESIRNPNNGLMESFSEAYAYAGPGQLQEITHGTTVIAHHSYDANGNRTGGTSLCGITNPATPTATASASATNQTPTATSTPTPTGTPGTATPTATATPNTMTFQPASVVIHATVVANSMNQISDADVVDAFCLLHHYAYQYSACGGIATKTDTLTGEVTAYTYDTFCNLRTITQSNGPAIAYLYDATGRRMGKTVNGTRVQAFLYQDAIRPVAELDANNTVTGVFVYGSKGNVPDYIQRGAAKYRLISDQIGSVRLVIDASTGAIVQRLDYDQYGNVILDTNPGFQPFGYAGGLYDPDTKLVRFGARDYDTETGRWTAKDPIGFDGGGGNLYKYVTGDPVNWVDPTGLWTVQLGISLSGQVGPLSVNLNVGVVVDQHGNVGTYTTGFGGGGLGAGASGGVSVGASTGDTIYDIAGPFLNTSASFGAGVDASLDAFSGPGSQGQLVTGEGFTLGLGGGAGWSLGGSKTWVHPIVSP